MLPRPLVDALGEQLERARKTHDRDPGDGFGVVWLPDALRSRPCR
jgi:hypothetical protein